MSPSELLQGENKFKARRAAMLVLLGLALISTSVGLWNAAHHSQDFQWSGERLLLEHADPWAEYLRGDPDHRFVLSQVPNYLPILYLLLAPVGLLPLGLAKLAWAACNLIFAVVSVLAAGRAYKLTGRPWMVVGCLFLMATATRNSIGNGQQSLLVLMLWCLTLLSPHWNAARAQWSGLAYFKFSFAPPMVFFLLFRRGVKAAGLSLVPAGAALLLVWLWLTGGRDPGSLMRLALEPIAVARLGFSAAPDDPNLMNLMEPFLRGFGPGVTGGVEFAMATAICLALSYVAFQRRGEDTVPWQMALMATMSYGLFKHHPYDAVVLLLPLCHAVSRWREWRAKAALVLIAYLFYGQRLLEAIHLHGGRMRLAEFVMLMAILQLTYSLGMKEVRLEPKKGIHAVEKVVKRAAA